MEGGVPAALSVTRSAGSGGSADEFQIAHFVYVLQYLVTRVTFRCNVFVDLFIPLPSKTLTFESISGRHSFRNAIKSRCFRRSCPEEVKKTLHRSVTRVTNYCKTHLKRAKWNSFLKSRGSHGSPGSPGSGVRECGWDPPFHTRRGPG